MSDTIEFYMCVDLDKTELNVRKTPYHGFCIGKVLCKDNDFIEILEYKNEASKRAIEIYFKGDCGHLLPRVSELIEGGPNVRLFVGLKLAIQIRQRCAHNSFDVWTEIEEEIGAIMVYIDNVAPEFTAMVQIIAKEIGEEFRPDETLCIQDCDWFSKVVPLLKKHEILIS